MTTGATKDRLAWGAGDLFYAEGITATGVQRIASVLGVSKRTMYELFESKDDLVAAALAARDPVLYESFVAGACERSTEPAGQLLGLLESAEAMLVDEGFRGCPFLNATAELADPAHPAHAVCQRHKQRLRNWMAGRARAAGLPHPTALSRQLMLILDGAMSQAAIGAYRRGTATAIARALLGSRT